MDEFNLDRFIDGQNTPYANYDRALSEVRNGNKVSHWIWYIFPNLRKLGHSKFSQFYGITCREEANEYLKHPILGVRLREITEALLGHEGKAPDEIFGSTDARKVKSCMTLFDCISPNDVFAKVLDSFYNGKRDNCSIISTGEKQENHDNYSVIGHLFLIAIKTFFESFEENAPKPLKSIELFRKGQQLRIPNGKLLLLPLNCISDPDNVINLFYDGQKSYDGYYFLNYKYATVKLTHMGAWQVALLLASTYIMPLFSHANYHKIQLILSKGDLLSLRKSPGYEISNHDFLTLEMPFTPSVTQLDDGKSYEVVYYYWSEFEGYIEQHIKISPPEGNRLSHKIMDLKIQSETMVIYSYQAPIRL